VNWTTIDQLCLNVAMKTAFREHIANRDILFVWGEPGTGKTTSIELITEELGRNLIHINASIDNTRELLRGIIGNTYRGVGLDGRESVILFDECEGLRQPSPGHTRKINKYLRHLAKYHEVAIVFVANSTKKVPKILGEIVDRTLMLKSQSQAVVLHWATRTYAHLDQEFVKKAVSRCKGDMRWLVGCLDDGILYEAKEAEFAPTVDKLVYWILTTRNRPKLFDILVEELNKGREHITPRNILYWLEENVAHYYSRTALYEPTLTILAQAGRTSTLLVDEDEQRRVFAALLCSITPRRIKRKMSFPTMYTVEHTLRKKTKAKLLPKVHDKRRIIKKGKFRGPKTTKTKRGNPKSTGEGGLLTWLGNLP